MTNYVKGFCVSLLLHGTMLILVLWVAMGNAITEKEILVVDFSAIALGQPNEGGVLPGGENARGTDRREHASSVPEQAPPPEEAFTPKTKPVMTPQPDPAVTSKPKPVLRASATRAVSEQQPAKVHEQSSAMASPDPAGGGGAGSGASAGTPAGRGADSGSGTGTDKGLTQSYVRSNFNYILVSIRRHLQYPDYARRQRLSGTAHFAFVIKQDGTIENLSLKESSGHDILDEAAEKAIQRAAPFPRPQEPALLLVPISFRLS